MLARVPVLAWLFLVFCAIVGSDNSYIGGLFEITESWGLFWIAFTALLVSLGMLMAANLVIEHGPQRIQQQDAPDGYVLYTPSRTVFFIGLAPAIAIMTVVYRTSAIQNPAATAFEILGGYAAAFLVFSLAQIVQFLVSNLDPYKTPNFLIYPLERVLVLRWILILAYVQQGRVSGWARDRLNRIAQLVAVHKGGRGYIFIPPPSPNEPKPEGKQCPEEAAKRAQFYAGHLFSFGLGMLYIVMWLVIGAIKQKNIADTSGQLPSLAYVLLAAMVLMWLLSTLSFFLDRWRVPVLLIIILWSIVVGRSTETDHYFRLVIDSQHPVTFPDPGEVFSSRAKPVIIATAGGGIQAGAWTTEVVEQLQYETGHERKPEEAVIPNLVLVSSVSGGSLGSLYLGQALYQFQPGGRLDLSLHKATEDARMSSLDEVAWGMANPDLWRTLFPFVRDPVVDRGWALERTWEERSKSQEVYLSDWAYAAQEKKMPAFIFNATIIETGSPIVLTNTNFPGSGNHLAITRHLRNTQQVLGVDSKLRVSTAARLSATFPFVSPAARGYPSPALHLVDGGYYDNFGIATGLLWLDEAMASAHFANHDVGLIQIRPNDLEDESPGTITGWSYQSRAPIDGILSVRDYDQFRADEALLNLIQEKWGANSKVKICPFHFVYPRNAPAGCTDQPMSWKLTQVQKQCIDDTWQAALADPQSHIHRDLQWLKEFLSIGSCPADSLNSDIHRP